ncbi:cytochrome c5 family protein, partial [Burkholderia latens]
MPALPLTNADAGDAANRAPPAAAAPAAAAPAIS